jgi:hypothetical protein
MSTVNKKLPLDRARGFTVKWPRDDFNRLQKAADDNKITLSDLIRRCVAEGLADTVRPLAPHEAV